MTKPQSLTAFCPRSYTLLNSVGLLPEGRELIALFGQGDAPDNMVALQTWLGDLGDTGAARLDDASAGALFRLKLRSSVFRMCNDTPPERAPLPGLFYSTATVEERNNLAYAIVFLISCYLAEMDARLRTQFSRRWKVDRAVVHCRDALLNFDLNYQVSPSELLTRLAHKYLHQCVKPWLTRSGRLGTLTHLTAAELH